MKMKLLKETCSSDLEKALHTFLVEMNVKKIIDIKYQKTLSNEYLAILIYL